MKRLFVFISASLLLVGCNNSSSLQDGDIVSSIDTALNEESQSEEGKILPFKGKEEKSFSYKTIGGNEESIDIYDYCKVSEIGIAEIENDSQGLVDPYCLLINKPVYYTDNDNNFSPTSDSYAIVVISKRDGQGYPDYMEIGFYSYAALYDGSQWVYNGRSQINNSNVDNRGTIYVFSYPQSIEKGYVEEEPLFEIHTYSNDHSSTNKDHYSTYNDYYSTYNNHYSSYYNHYSTYNNN